MHSSRRHFLIATAMPPLAGILLSTGKSSARRLAPAQPAGVWRPAGTLLFGRWYTGTARLAGGGVLLAGGVSSGSAGTRRTELYDPASETVAEAGPISRLGLSTMVTLEDGRVLSYGAIVGPVAELFDPSSGTWSATAPPAAASTTVQTLTLLAGGRVLALGTFQDTVITEIFDPQTGEWQRRTAPDLTIVRLAARDGAGRVLALGGRAGDGTRPLTHSMSYYPDDDRWAQLPDLNYFVARLVTLADGRVLALTTSGRLFALESGGAQWQPLATMDLAPEYSAAATVLSDGTLLVAGGGRDGVSTRRYDPASDQWSEGPRLQEPRAHHGLVALPDGGALALGGMALGQNVQPEGRTLVERLGE